jgi:inner membrane protein
MTPNHITEELFYRFILCFFSINIFANPIFISVTILGSYYPISIILNLGKNVYPIAKWLSRNYGHRTITHSIFF